MEKGGRRRRGWEDAGGEARELKSERRRSIRGAGSPVFFLHGPEVRVESLSTVKLGWNANVLNFVQFKQAHRAQIEMSNTLIMLKQY
jgi:hypothetical protein